MQFKIAGSALAAAVSRLVSVIEAKSTPRHVPKDKFIRIDGHKDSIRLSAFSPVMEAQIVLNWVTPTEPFQVGVSYDLFASVAKALPDGEVSFKVKGSTAELKSASSTFKLALIEDPEIFPDRDLPGRLYGAADVPALIAGLSHVAFCTNKEGLQPYHRLISVDGGSFAATDGMRLSVVPNKSFKCPGSMLLTADTCARISAFFAGVSGEGGVGSDEEQRELVVMCAGHYVALRLAQDKDAKFPNFRSLMPVGAAPAKLLPRKETIAALRRIMVVLNEGGIPQVTVKLLQQAVALKCANSTGSVGEESLTVEGDAIGEFVLNGTFFLQALQNFETETVTFQYRGPNAPLLLTDGESKHVFQRIPQSDS